MLTAISPPAPAQDNYPSTTVRLVTGFPSGVLDLLARQVAQKLSAQLNSSVIVDSRLGANGNIAAEFVARAKPDGHTLLVNTASVVFSPAFGDKLGYDVARDLAPVCLLASSSFVLVVTYSLPVKTLAEFIRLAKANPDKLAYGSTGNGSISHLGPLLFLQANGLKALHVPYKGGAQVITDLASGYIQFAMQGQANALPLVKAKRLKALAFTGIARSPQIPDIPTLDETVMRGFELSTWQAVMAPAKTPAAVIRRINAELLKALQDPELKSRLEFEGAVIRGTTPEAYAAYLKTELERWARVVKINNIKLE